MSEISLAPVVSALNALSNATGIIIETLETSPTATTWKFFDPRENGANYFTVTARTDRDETTVTTYYNDGTAESQPGTQDDLIWETAELAEEIRDAKLSN